MSDWLNWAVQNVTPERLQSAMGYVKQHPEQLQALKEQVGGEIRDAIAEEQGPEKAQTWSSWLGLKSGAAPTATTTAPRTTPPTAIQSTRQKYIRLAVKNWKYSIPAAMWFFSFVMSWLWWAFILVGIVLFLKKRKTKSA